MRYDKLRRTTARGARRLGVFILLLIASAMHISLVNAADITVEGDCTLAQAIESANQDRAVDGCGAGSGADTITLTSDILLYAELPAISSPIAIAGGDFLISGDSFFRIFFIAEDGDLSIDSLTLQDGQAAADARACIEWDEGEWAAGGAICNLGALSISASRFSGNAADFGGAIASVGTVTISESELSGNAANGGGAIFNWDGGALTIMASDFADNTARLNMALLETILAAAQDSDDDDDLRIALDPIFFVGHGGAIASSLGGEITITESTFRSNEADLSGGAILDHGTMAISDSQFSNNASNHSSGGAIESGMGAITVTGSEFSGNTAGSGGAVKVWGTFTVSESDFNDNSAGRGGAIYTPGGTVSVTGGVFSGNSARDSGGAIFTFSSAGGLVSATDSVFSGNSAEFRGGAIFATGAFEISHSVFSGNRAGDLGGAIINEGKLTLRNNDFSGNAARNGGGGVYNSPDNELSQAGNRYSNNRGGDCAGCG